MTKLAKHDKVIKMRDKLVSKMLSTLKSLKHESIHPDFEEIIQKKLGVESNLIYEVKRYPHGWDIP
jgi:hypothetical protein